MAPTQQKLAISSVFFIYHNWWPAKKKLFPKKQQLANFIILVFFCEAWHSSQTMLLITACKREEQETFQKLGSCQLDRSKTWSTLYMKMEEKNKMSVTLSQFLFRFWFAVLQFKSIFVLLNCRSVFVKSRPQKDKDL